MGAVHDPFEAMASDESVGDFENLLLRAPTERRGHSSWSGAAVTGRLLGFDTEDQPLVSGLAAPPGHVVAARTAVSLRRQMVGSEVVVVYDGGNLERPIIIGVIESRRFSLDDAPVPADLVSIEADNERFVVNAEREIVLRCGDSSITLTRAGKVIIKGSYILSRSSGYNKIKGAAIDLN